MSTENQTQPELTTRLNIRRLTEAKAPGFKLLANSLVIVRIDNYEAKPSKTTQTPMANWTFGVLPGDNVQFSDGETVTTEQKLFHSYSLRPTDKYDPDSMLRAIVEAVDPELLEKDELQLSEVYGKFVKAKVVIAPERTDKATGKTYQARNEIKSFEPLTHEELKALLGQ